MYHGTIYLVTDMCYMLYYYGNYLIPWVNIYLNVPFDTITVPWNAFAKVIVTHRTPPALFPPSSCFSCHSSGPKVPSEAGLGSAVRTQAPWSGPVHRHCLSGHALLLFRVHADQSDQLPSTETQIMKPLVNVWKSLFDIKINVIFYLYFSWQKY